MMATNNKIIITTVTKIPIIIIKIITIIILIINIIIPIIIIKNIPTKIIIFPNKGSPIIIIKTDHMVIIPVLETENHTTKTTKILITIPKKSTISILLAHKVPVILSTSGKKKIPPITILLQIMNPNQIIIIHIILNKKNLYTSKNKTHNRTII